MSFLFCLPSLSEAQAYRDNLPLPLNEVLQNMQNYGEAQDFERLKKASALLHPVTAALAKDDASLGADMDKAVASKDAAAAVSVIHRVAWADLHEMFAAAERASGAEASRHVKAAFLDYVIISPTMQTRSLATDQRIKNLFKRASAVEATSADRHALLLDIVATATKAYPVLK